MAGVAGRVILGADHLLLKGVPVVAPAGGAAGAERGGEELIRSLDLRVEKGQHTLITGPKSVPLIRLVFVFSRFQSSELTRAVA
jgi:ATP-binding cassette subfamily D (ALD) long-chain fatty acid import protein